MDLQEQIAAALRDVGFEDVQVHKQVVPWGPWPKDKKLKKLGHTMAAALETGIEVRYELLSIYLLDGKKLTGIYIYLRRTVWRS